MIYALIICGPCVLDRCSRCEGNCPCEHHRGLEDNTPTTRAATGPDGNSTKRKSHT